jgi:hypothetical protein
MVCIERRAKAWEWALLLSAHPTGHASRFLDCARPLSREDLAVTAFERLFRRARPAWQWRSLALRAKFRQDLARSKPYLGNVG